MSMTFLVTVEDDGRATIDKLSDPVAGGERDALLRALRDPAFESAVLDDGSRIDIHVKLDNDIKRDLIVTLLDDTVPAFSSPEEAETWMAQRQAGRSAHG